MLLTNIFLFLVFSVLLVVSALFSVRSMSRIAQFLRLSEFVVGFVLMSLFTTMPEFFIGIASALDNEPALSLGNVIGSVVINLTLVCGLVILLAGRIDTKGPIKRDAFRLFFVVLVPIVLMFIGGGMSRLDGILLLLLFCYYVYNLYKQRRAYTVKVGDHVKKWEMVINPIIALVAIVILFFSSRGVVRYGGLLAEDLGLPYLFIGLFFIAISTSLPELAFGIVAARTKHAVMSLGDLIGAGYVNSTLVLGVTAVISPIVANFTLFLTSALFMILVVFIFAVFIESERRLDWKEGLALVLFYVFFLIVELSVSGFLRT